MEHVNNLIIHTKSCKNSLQKVFDKISALQPGIPERITVPRLLGGYAIAKMYTESIPPRFDLTRRFWFNLILLIVDAVITTFCPFRGIIL